MGRYNLQILCILFSITLLCGCSTEKERSCDKCETYFSENSQFTYPERTLEYKPTGCGTGSAAVKENEIKLIQKRLLTPREFKDMESLKFCFIGKERNFVLSFFKDFKIEDYSTDFTRDTDSSFTFINSHVGQKKPGYRKEIYKSYSMVPSKEIAFTFNNINGKGIY